MTTNPILIGLGLIVLLAVGSPVVASQLRLLAVAAACDVPGHGVVAPYTGGKTLVGRELSGPVVTQRYQDGAHSAVRRGRELAPEASEVLFVIRADGQLVPVTEDTTPEHQEEDITVLLEPQQVMAGSAPLSRRSGDS